MNECTPSLPPLLTFINQVAQNALVLASPVVLVLLRSEVFPVYCRALLRK